MRKPGCVECGANGFEQARLFDTMIGNQQNALGS
jgi:hypothetical protein